MTLVLTENISGVLCYQNNDAVFLFYLFILVVGKISLELLKIFKKWGDVTKQGEKKRREPNL